MIVQQNNETGVSLGFDSSIKSKVKEKDLGFMFRTLSSSLYTDKLGSLIRETVCNCFDAYIGLTKTPVALIRYNAQDRSLSFVDKGKGMSREFIETTYVDFFDSTKRDEAGSFGAFGLGGKVGLAINDSFYIESVKDGEKALYLYSYNKDNPLELPNLDLISSQQTDEENGTTIKVHLPQDSAYSIYNISYAIETQLKYFDSVVVEGLNSFEPKIYRGKNFIISEGLTKELEICFGKVRYPLNYDLIGIDRYSYFRKLPIALYFDLNSPLFPTPSREGLQYTPETIDLIKEKFDLAIEELKELYRKNNLKITSIKEFSTVGFNTIRRFNVGQTLIEGSWLDPYELELPFAHHFKVFKSNGDFHDLMNGGHYIYIAKRPAYGAPVFYSKEFKVGKAKQEGASKVYYGYGKSLNYVYLLPLFYDSSLIQVIRTDVVNDKNELERVYEISNPSNIDYETELRSFYDVWNKEIEETYKCLDEVELEKRDYTGTRATKEEIKEHDPNTNARNTTVTPIEELRKFKYLVYLDYDTEHWDRDFSRWKLYFHSTYKIIQGKSVKHLVRFISCNKTEKKKLDQLPNLITLEEFMNTDLYKKFNERSGIRAKASELASRLSHRPVFGLELRQLKEEVDKLAIRGHHGRIESPFNPFKGYYRNPRWEGLETQFSEFYALRVLKNYYKSKVEKLRQHTHGKN